MNRHLSWLQPVELLWSEHPRIAWDTARFDKGGWTVPHRIANNGHCLNPDKSSEHGVGFSFSKPSHL